MSHSPLPWKYWPTHWAGGHNSHKIDGENTVWIENERGEEIARLCLRKHYDDGGLAVTDQVLDNAKLIVTAVNNHAALVSSLDSCLTQIEQMAGMFDDSDGAIARAADNARDLLAEIRNGRDSQPEPVAGTATDILREIVELSKQDSIEPGELEGLIEAADELLNSPQPEPSTEPNTPASASLAVALAALKSVAEIIENTYAHDDDGERIDDAGEYSAADIVEQVCNAENEVSEAIALLEANADPVQPRVLIEISRGLADYSTAGNVEVCLIDYDNEPDAEVPEEFQGFS